MEKLAFNAHRQSIKKAVAIETTNSLPGLPGAFFRLRVCLKGVEIRSFYHRHGAPFKKIKHISIEKGYFDIKIHLAAGACGFPEYVPSSGKPFQAVALQIERQFKSAKRLLRVKPAVRRIP